MSTKTEHGWKGARMETDLYGISQVAQALGVSHYTIRRLIEAGEIKAINIGARRLVPAAEVDRIAREGAGSPKTRQRKRQQTMRKRNGK